MKQYYNLNTNQIINENDIVIVDNIKYKIKQLDSKKLKELNIFSFQTIYESMHKCIELFDNDVKLEINNEKQIVLQHHKYKLKNRIEIANILKNKIFNLLGLHSKVFVSVDEYTINADLFALSNIESLIDIKLINKNLEHIKELRTEASLNEKNILFKLYNNTYTYVSINDLLNFKRAINDLRLKALQLTFNISQLVNECDIECLIKICDYLDNYDLMAVISLATKNNFVTSSS